ncbi:hypothetical protein KSK37_13005 [Kaistella sp. DKR-2]|uniref:DUF6759 domain-containing protein n=1 Tax=Kaistella soli TaxID=2849654 RepID=UPI001C25C241|nr:DUF6759 domain-containing protein [Kaistella soli]MBU8884008.1 hypothetical protein [Kaistella soli]
MKNTILFLIALFAMNSCFKKEIDQSSLVSSTDSTVLTVDSSAVAIDAAVNMDTLTDSSSVVETSAIMTFDEASRVNSSAAWKQFLIDNPDYNKKQQIEDNIIRAEVREIAADSNTGQMPEAERVGSSSSAISTIDVENNTSCDLTLLYSGNDAKRIIIAPNSKRKISLGSGRYSVAANACGYNYAGSENLMGDYSVVYYISTVRY